MGETEVKRWRRHGMDRLYVNGAGGINLGWHDLISGETHLAVAEAGPAVHEAIEAWRTGKHTLEGVPDAARHEKPSGPAGAVPPTGSSAAPAQVGEGWIGGDLVWREAGSMPREQAIALERAAPARTWLARLAGVHTEERAWRIGAHGERLVAERLIALRRRDPSWGFLHSIPVGDRKSDVDHLVVGPGGVFTINTKNHPGGRIWVGADTVMVNGHRVPYVRNSRHEARRAGRLLARALGAPVEVVPLVVFVGLPDITVASAPDGVFVLRARSLVEWLLRRPPVLERPAIEAIFAVARRPSTWRAAPGAR